MTRRDGRLLTAGVALASLLLLATSALAGLRAPEGTAALGSTLAADAGVQELVADALIEELLADAAERSPAASELLPLIRPLLDRAARIAIESPAGRAALASALTDALRQLTFGGPIIIDLRAAALVAADTAPAPLDTLARAAVEQGSVGVIVLGGGEYDPDLGVDAPPSDDELSRVAGLPAGLATALAGLLLGLLVLVLIGRDREARPRRLVLAGTPLLLIGSAVAVLLRFAPGVIVDRVAGAVLDGTGPSMAIVVLLADGLGALLEPTFVLAAALAVVGLGLAATGLRSRARRH